MRTPPAPSRSTRPSFPFASGLSAWCIATSFALGACTSAGSTSAGSTSTAGTNEAASATPATSDVVRGETLTLAHVQGDKAVDFSGRIERDHRWLDAGHWLVQRDGWKRIALDGKAERWMDFTAAEASLAKINAQKKPRSIASLGLDRYDAQRRAVLFEADGDLYVVRVAGGDPVRLTHTPDAREELESFSPDGTQVAFVRDNDLFVVEIGGGERRLTTDGGENVLNGKLDWLYQEEVYGRGNFQANWWAPDSKHVAFLRIDQTGVPRYTLVDDAAEPQRVEVSPYPRAGETNPTVRIAIARVHDGQVAWNVLDGYQADEPLVVDVAWSPSNELHYQVQDREQRWLDLRRANVDWTKDERLFRETTPAWVERKGSPTFLKDGTFLWASERDGYEHLYRYDGSKLLAQVTRGEWEARTLHGVDENAGVVYFSGTERSVLESHAYRVDLDGKNLRRLTDRAGTHSVKFSPDFAHYIDTWSDVSTPSRVFLCDAQGREVRVLDENNVASLGRFTGREPEFVQVRTRDGFTMEGMIVKPSHFDPAKRYPVMMFTYAGPHAQTVRNAWGGTTRMFHQFLAEQGVLVWSCDNRTASGKGAVSTWPCYQRLGEVELADIEDGLAWLRSQSYVDGERIGISGWSYGGFITSYALTHSKSFALGIAGGSVTDWKEYDSIYTERYMRTPQRNPKGYEATSVTNKAEDLHGHLVLGHGAIDDNVHPANSIKLANALGRANKSFELVLFPSSRHSPGAFGRYWRELTWDRIQRYLLQR